MASKYDGVKVKVHLGEHYYVLSRFLLSKILTFCEVPTTTAVRLSLELKKDLVDKQQLDITQDELQKGIFSMMIQHGYGNQHVKLYRTMAQFYTQRVPLVVFIAGTGCSGKSTVTQLLGSKLSHHNIVNTEVVMDTAFSILQASPVASSSTAPQESPSSPAASPCTARQMGSMGDPLWFSARKTSELIEMWQERSRQVAEFIDRDIVKTLREGKVLLIEGTYLDLPLYQKYFALSSHAAKEKNAIVMAFVLRVPTEARCFLTEQWLDSRSHFLPEMSLPQQVAYVSESFEHVHEAHIKSLKSGSLDPSHVTTIDFLPNDTTATVSQMHGRLLDRIVEELDARQTNHSATFASFAPDI